MATLPAHTSCFDVPTTLVLTICFNNSIGYFVDVSSNVVIYKLEIPTSALGAFLV